MTSPYIQQPGPEFTIGSQDAPQAPQPTYVVPQPVPVPMPTIPASQTPAQYFTAEDLERARTQEKDKLYGRLSQAEESFKAVQAQLATIQAERDAISAQQQAAADADKLAAQRAAEEEMSAKQLIAAKEAEWQQQLSKIQQERETERVLMEKERAFADLRAYVSQRAQQEAENIAPELLDLITGNTREEVEASIQMLITKTNSMFTGIRDAMTATQPPVRGVSTAGYAAAGPMDNEPGQRQLSNEDLKNMPMSEYAKNRGQLLGAASQSAHRGLFG